MRLIDITVDEVSLVDKAANNRKFAFLKRDDTKEIVKEEVKEAQKIIDDKDELSAEDKEQLNKIIIEIGELTALVKKD